MNGMAKYVVSSSLARADWNNTTIISGDLVEELSTVKRASPGDILIAGSGQLVRALTTQRLIDEYRLMVFPVVLGVGKGLFAGVECSAPLRLVSSQPAGECVILNYEPLESSS
jgi:dihydrofolate reductase